MAGILNSCSDPLALTQCAALTLQSIEDVEDTRDGATMHLQELSALIDQVRANIEAIHGATLLLPLRLVLSFLLTAFSPK